MRRTSSKAAPAAARSTIDWPRSEVASAGGSVEAAARGGVESQAHRPGQPHVALVDVRQQPEGHQVSSGPGRPAPATVGTGVGEVVEDRPRRSVELLEQGRAPRRPGGPAAAGAGLATTRTGRSGEPHTSASVRSRSSARSTASGEAASSVGSLSWTIAWSTASSSASSPSSARSTEAFTTIRAASCEESCGAGRREVRPRLEQRRQLLVRPAAELVGEGAWGGRGHPANSTGTAAGRPLRSLLDLRGLAGSTAWR